jgi:benzodiazapine receptor
MDILDYYPLGLFLLANFAAACSGAFFRPGQWYEDLKKPSWRPPNWVFAPAWSVLYVMIAIAGWMVWEDAGPGESTLPMTIYFVHLVLNFAWSGIFFGMKRIDLAFFEIIALWGTLIAIIVTFHPINTTAAYLLIPYLFWASFAGVLNFVVWQMNKASLSNAA